MAKMSLKIAVQRAVAGCCPPRKAPRPRPMSPYARVFKALGDETRVEIIRLIAAAGTELCACDIEGYFDLSQPTISHHLRVLRDAGLVTAERRATWVYYALRRDTLALLPEFFALLGE